MPPINKPHGDPPPTPTPPLIIQLVNAEVVILSQSNVGETVIIQSKQNPVVVATMTGIRIGDVKQEDAAKVKQKQATQGKISHLDVNSAHCFVEVF